MLGVWCSVTSCLRHRALPLVSAPSGTVPAQPPPQPWAPLGPQGVGTPCRVRRDPHPQASMDKRQGSFPPSFPSFPLPAAHPRAVPASPPCSGCPDPKPEPKPPQAMLEEAPQHRGRAPPRLGSGGWAQGTGPLCPHSTSTGHFGDKGGFLPPPPRPPPAEGSTQRPPLPFPTLRQRRPLPKRVRGGLRSSTPHASSLTPRPPQLLPQPITPLLPPPGGWG